MTPESFEKFANAFRDALLLVAPDGTIHAGNQQAATAIGVVDQTQLRHRDLAEVAGESAPRLKELLRLARRTSDETIGAIDLGDPSLSHRVIARRITGADERIFLMLRIEPQHIATRQFAALNEKFDQLNREIARRRAAELQLRTERDVAEFGRDIGIALVQSRRLDEALMRCTELMVSRLNAAFARIWLADEEQTELILIASSGLYTHVDGQHSRIRFGDYKIGRIAQRQRSHVTNRVIGDAEVHDQEWAKREGMIAFAGYPLIDDGVTVGVMAMFARHPIGESVTALLATVANGVALRIRKQSIEDGLARQTEALREADRRKDEFLAMLSHELRNPLVPVRSGLDLLVLSDSDHQDAIRMMQRQVEHLVRLVDDLLDVSRIMRGKVELRRERVQVAQLVEHARDMLRHTIDQAGHQLTIRLPEQPVWVEADPVRLTQVIENLLKNACKYTDHGGKLSITVTKQDDDQALIRVQDNGVGIEIDLLPQVFELFTQSTRTLERSQGGLGIGLTLVKNLVEMHGGTVSVTSDGLGTGSTFTVRLPCCHAPCEPDEAAVRSTANVISCPLRVLAVDDNRAARLMLEKIFEKLGAEEVATAEDGPSALEAFSTFRPNLVLLDIGLPGMDGYELARRIRQSATDDSFLLVALTGYGQHEDRQKSKLAGFDDHLVKPPSIDQLRQLLSHPRFNRS
ncbi:hybrid sensor histidine kinase/response regulator [Stieleria neptunia]|uniref:hybrid sensor histidine kinase/response regulator n=1 Tax=Stieleria neptunia TaxID=2527979 RepID=UPI0011A1427F|nr:hybrid sensor histidine kinase/response regulator [Stieleria neptunia]